MPTYAAIGMQRAKLKISGRKLIAGVAVLIGRGIAPGGVFIACVSTAVSRTIQAPCRFLPLKT